MSTTQTDRIAGPFSSASIKLPCRVATVGQNLTLAELQTIDGIALAVGDRVLVKDQTDETANGIYVVALSAWQRSSDFALNRDVVQGTQVWSGPQPTYQAGGMWIVITANPIIIGTSDILFEGSQPKSGAVFTAPGPSTMDPGQEFQIVDQTVGAPFTLNVEPSPQPWQRHTIIDGKGDAAANPISIVGTFPGGQIKVVIETNGGRASIVYDPDAALWRQYA